MLPKRGRQCFANGNVKGEFVLKHVHYGEDVALSAQGKFQSVCAFFSLKKEEDF